MSDLFETTADRSLTAKRDEATAASDARDWPRAAALWDELRTAQPQDPHWWFKAGEAYSEGRVLDRAEDILGEAVVRFPDHCWIAYRYAVLARYAGDFGEGSVAQRPFIRSSPRPRRSASPTNSVHRDRKSAFCKHWPAGVSSAIW